MVHVNWYYAVQYANWVSRQMNLPTAYEIDKENKDPNNLNENDKIKWTVQLKDNKGYRLPTEAEWEFAARGGKKAKKSYIYSGSDTLDIVGWYDENSNSRPQAVGTKKANDLGIMDMSGNVWEWCWDWYGSYPEEVKVFENPRGPKQGKRRILRGGSWEDYGIRVYVRDKYIRGLASARRILYYGNSGFRLVRGQ